MKNISKKAISLLTIPIGFILSLISSCGHRVYDSPPCVYGPPPEEFQEEEIRHRPVVYGPPSVKVIDKDTLEGNETPSTH